MMQHDGFFLEETDLLLPSIEDIAPCRNNQQTNDPMLTEAALKEEEMKIPVLFDKSNNQNNPSMDQSLVSGTENDQNNCNDDLTDWSSEIPCDDHHNEIPELKDQNNCNDPMNWSPENFRNYHYDENQENMQVNVNPPVVSEIKTKPKRFRRTRVQMKERDKTNPNWKKENNRKYTKNCYGRKKEGLKELESSCSTLKDQVKKKKREIGQKEDENRKAYNLFISKLRYNMDAPHTLSDWKGWKDNYDEIHQMERSFFVQRTNFQDIQNLKKKLEDTIEKWKPSLEKCKLKETKRGTCRSTRFRANREEKIAEYTLNETLLKLKIEMLDNISIEVDQWKNRQTNSLCSLIANGKMNSLNNDELDFIMAYAKIPEDSVPRVS